MRFSRYSVRTKLPSAPLNKLKPRRPRDPFLLALLIFSALYFLFYYFTDPLRPAGVFNIFGFHDVVLHYPKGWFGFNDQGDYLRLAHTLADFNFSRLHSTFLYGLGYPIVAVPMLWLGLTADPFVVFNLFAFVFAIYATYRAGSRLVSPVCGLIAGFGLAFATPLVQYTDQPWNSTVCLVAVGGILLAAAAQKIKAWHALVLGLLVGWAFAARYADAIFLGVLAIAALYRGSFKALIKGSLLVIVGAALLIAPVLYTQNQIFGSPLKTPYVLHTMKGKKGSDQQLSAYSTKDIGDKLGAMLAGPRIVGKSDLQRGLLVEMFWALAAIPGAYILFKRSPRKLFVSVLIVFTIAVSFFYLCFRGTSIDSLKFGLLHYFKMLWPGAAIMAAAFFESQFSKISYPKAAKRTKKPNKKS